MADFYRVSGTAGAIGDGKGWVSTAAGASFIGKQPLALAIVIQDSSLGKANLASELDVNLAVPAIINAIEANATVLAYQVEPGSSGNLSVILEGAAGLTAADVQAAIRGGAPSGLYGNNSVDASGTVVVNRGLKLSYT